MYYRVVRTIFTSPLSRIKRYLYGNARVLFAYMDPTMQAIFHRFRDRFRRKQELLPQ